MTNCFGLTHTFNFSNSCDALYSDIELYLNSIDKKFLCNNYELYLIKSVGFNIKIFPDTGEPLLLDGYEHNKYTSEERVIENELFGYKNSYNDKIQLPLFPKNYLQSLNYLETLKLKKYCNVISGYSVELIIEFCEIKDIVMSNDELNFNSANLSYKIL